MKLTKELFIDISTDVHNNKYSYDKVEYVNSTTSVIITCPIHGDFKLLPKLHMNGHGCLLCKSDKLHKCFSSNTELFIKRAIEVHGDKYDYSKVEYINAKTDVIIICPIHGEFRLKPHHHLNGCGCAHCSGELNAKPRKMSKDIFIERALLIHDIHRYDYSLITDLNFNYTGKVPIICPIHGVFYLRASTHLEGHGCPECHNSKLEKIVAKNLGTHDIKYVVLYSPDWLNRMRLDFYLPDYNIAIECLGLLHFKPIKYWGGEETYNKIIERDKLKLLLCNEHNIDILYFSIDDIEFPYLVYNNIEELIKKIK